jgi:hypothetical protein
MQYIFSCRAIFKKSRQMLGHLYSYLVHTRRDTLQIRQQKTVMLSHIVFIT